jgi:pyruvate dehydrogenase E2 component (dihydrolipoamide acetyltransferase)
LPKNVIMPALGVAQETGRVVRWLKSDGDNVHQGDMLLEVETDKATVELEAVASGVLRSITAVAGDEVPVGTVIAKIWAEGEIETQPAEPSPAGNGKSGSLEKIDTETTEARKSATNLPRQTRASQFPLGGEFERSSRRTPSSPKARRLAAERGIDLDRLSTGNTQPMVASVVLQSEGTRGIQASHMAPSRIWRIMAERTTEAWKTVPHFYLNRQIDVSQIVGWREGLRASLPGVTYTDLLVRKVAACLRLHPQLTSEWRDGTIQRHPEINIGLAVAVDQGLVVPVIRNADQTTVTGIALERQRLVERARAGKLSLEDLSGGTFTISNLGTFGVDSFQAIVNPPQAAILAVGRIIQRVVAIDDQPMVRPTMTLSLSCDHRVVDGVRAARFLGELATSLETVSAAED